jgi:hypothetical protein
MATDLREDVGQFASRVLRRGLWPHQIEVARSRAFITVIAGRSPIPTRRSARRRDAGSGAQVEAFGPVVPDRRDQGPLQQGGRLWASTAMNCNLKLVVVVETRGDVGGELIGDMAQLLAGRFVRGARREDEDGVHRSEPSR